MYANCLYFRQAAFEKFEEKFLFEDKLAKSATLILFTELYA